MARRVPPTVQVTRGPELDGDGVNRSNDRLEKDL
jgi:hypothetical protein